MFVTVMYNDGKVGISSVQQPDERIRSENIKKFMRSEGWVTVGKDPTRKREEKREGTDRRQNFRKTK